MKLQRPIHYRFFNKQLKSNNSEKFAVSITKKFSSNKIPFSENRLNPYFRTHCVWSFGYNSNFIGCHAKQYDDNYFSWNSFSCLQTFFTPYFVRTMMPMIVDVSAHYEQHKKAATVGLNFQMDSIYTDDNLSFNFG